VTKLPHISGRECIRALERAGFYERRIKGDHVFMQRDNPYAAAVVPLHKEVKPGTLRSIIRQAGLTVDEFVELL